VTRSSVPEPGEKLETLYEGWGRGDYSRSDVFDPEMRLAESLGAVYGTGTKPALPSRWGDATHTGGD
jgi:hypothetical protein